MNLRSITLVDFLPFQGKQTVTFATDREKNVTIVMGDNGAGKTSLAQAFEWCLYGRNPKGVKQVMNAYKRDRIPSGESRYVSVEIELVKDGIPYRIVRKQKYSRSQGGGRVRAEQSELSIFYKVDGQTHGVADDPRELRETIGRLLSDQLSHYFFFDGEHVKNMRAEIEHGKSQDFADAVKAILGLSPIASAIRHLKAPAGRGYGRNSVEKILTESLNLAGNEAMATKRSRIQSNERRIERLEEEISGLDEEAATASEMADKWSQLLKENQASEEAQRAVERAQRDVQSAESILLNKRNAFFKTFRNGSFRFFIEKPVHMAQVIMRDVDAESKGIPNINDVTIKYLLERHECICGTHFEVGDSIDEHLHELLKYVPPKDLGTYVSEFEKECRIRTEEPNALVEDLGAAYAEYRDAERALDAARDEFEIAVKHRDSIKLADVKVLRQNLAKAEQSKRHALEKQAVNKAEIAKAKSENRQLRDELSKAEFQDAKNRRIQHCLEYVDFIYRYLSDFYDTHETTVRNKLAKVVNKFFTTMYDGELYLTLDENYGVDVMVRGVDVADEDWQTSSGQTLAIILAFILGILEVAKNTNKGEDGLIHGDTYPLVMDAPLSDFDTTRIGTICNLLPKVAEQVVIIIKDTDGELAIEHLSEHIGSRYTIRRIKDYDSKIERD